MECKHCLKSFKNKYVLKTHQTTARYCLKIQKNNTQFICEYCGKYLTTKRWLLNHYQSCIDYRIFVETQKYKEKILDLEKQVEKHEVKISQLEDRLENVAIKAVQSPTTTNNMNKTQINTFIQNMQPVTKEHSAGRLTLEHVQKGATGYAEYALENQLKDRIICVDYGRRKIKFKDRDGKVITDPDMLQLAPMLLGSMKSKSSEIVSSQNKDNMSSVMFEEVANLFNTYENVSKGSEGVKTEFYHDFIKHVCSASVVE